jgi:hypothetical protein
VQLAASNAAAGLSFGSTCTLSKGSAVVFGASAACRYFAYAAPASADAQSTVAIDSAVEWADSCSSEADLLKGLEARLSSSGGSYIAGVSAGTECHFVSAHVFNCREYLYSTSILYLLLDLVHI